MRFTLCAISLVLVMGLIACGSNNANGKGAAIAQVGVDATDTKECHSATPVNPTIEGTWYQLMKKPGGVSEIYALSITKDSTTLTVECYPKTGDGIVASTTTPSSYDSKLKQYKNLGELSNTVTSGSLKCQAHLSPGIVNYDLSGTCIQVTKGSDVHYLVSTKPKIPDGQSPAVPNPVPSVPGAPNTPTVPTVPGSSDLSQ